ncbi:DUF4153 domain-containing protein [Pendulispora albinea]|uniref:DUF4173 domain-containing protein n=1 Tax=Pendulispora albinea TaxID=2741071 RepID=A0ABZ2M6J1_9BACT
MQDDAMPRVAGADVSLPFTDTQRRALMTLTIALALGVATQSLFWNTRLGLNFLLWDLMLAVAVLVTIGPRRPVATVWGAGTASVLFGVSIALRASAWSAAIAAPVAVALLWALPLLARETTQPWELPRVPLRLLARLAKGPSAAAAVVTLPFRIVGASQKTRARRVFVGLLLGLPAASVFVVLFSSDPEFGWLIHRATRSANRAVSFGAWSLLTAAGYLFVHALHRPSPSQQPARSPLPPPPAVIDPALRPPQSFASGEGSAYRDWIAPPAATSVPKAPEPLLSRETWGTLLVPIIGVFALFVGLNLRHVFHGHAYVRDASGPSYSDYLHAGFYQLLAATILSVCLVRVGHALLRARGEVGERVPGGARIRALEVTLLALTVLTLFSCVQRLALYEEAYGATYLRLGVAVIALGVFGVLGLSIAKSICRGWRNFGGATIFWLIGLALAASAFNADAYIAMRNLDRAAIGKPLDVAYLSGLSADALVALKHPYLTYPGHADLRCELEQAWRSARRSPRDWREARGF